MKKIPRRDICGEFLVYLEFVFFPLSTGAKQYRPYMALFLCYLFSHRVEGEAFDAGEGLGGGAVAPRGEDKEVTAGALHMLLRRAV